MARTIGSFSERRDKDFINDMTQEQQQQWAKEIMQRMMKAWGLKEQKEIATMVNCHHKMPANWIQSFSIPWSVIYTCHLDTGCSLDWLYNGKIATDISSDDIQREFIDSAKHTIDAAIHMDLISKNTPQSVNLLAKRLIKDLEKILQTDSEPQETTNK